MEFYDDKQLIITNELTGDFIELDLQIEYLNEANEIDDDDIDWSKRFILRDINGYLHDLFCAVQDFTQLDKYDIITTLKSYEPLKIGELRYKLKFN